MAPMSCWGGGFSRGKQQRRTFQRSLEKVHSEVHPTRQVTWGLFMKRMTLCSLVSIFVLAASVVQAQEVVTKKEVVVRASNGTTKVIPQAVNGASDVSLCSFCFTCGGAYPAFSGGFESVGDMPTERQGSCAEPLQASPDSFPFLCCKAISP